ncbi:hypothetical protein HS088_TW04G00519 [Tripterygium wilfordii]|uniref:Elongation factor Ts, mitochondrial n=1 Tax=Tripterygium wilfordii TaxID=458696 RepID=A0A7J7DQI7_TRIWF|nr:polyprotein of EF-Ts, chloroplastic-like [Tripterygium wilfordii]KAF5748563.1 hypothetical protein HS088_TW04G00519 [Tripterygium wilfordii]
MTPVIPCSTSNISLIPGTAFLVKKNCLTKCSTARKLTKYSKRLVLPLSNYVLFPQYSRESTLHHTSGVHLLSATGTDIAVEEPETPATDEISGGASESQSEAVETSENPFNKSDANPTPAQARRSRPGRKSEMPPVKIEELVSGATFTGKVRSIQPFGAFVDFGAFTDGLVHVSNLSNTFVKDVGNFVSVGQEVKVKILDANTETGRISLTMRESDDGNNPQQQKDVSSSSEKARSARRDPSKSSQKKNEVKSSKFVKGQQLQGTVKNLTRAGAFISLPDDEEGFLPTSEEADNEFLTMMGGSSLQVGQEVSVRVLRVTRGQVTLTMKTEAVQLDPQLSQGVVHVATNPFVLAFRQNKDIAAFLDERERLEKADKQQVKPVSSEKIEGKLDESETASDIPEMQGQADSSNVPLAVDENAKHVETSSKKADRESIVDSDSDTEFSVSSAQTVDGAAQVAEKESEIEGSVSTNHQSTEEASLIDEMADDGQLETSNEVANQNLSSESPVDEVVDDQGDDGAKDEVQIQESAVGSEISSSAPLGGMEPIPDENGSLTSSDNLKIDGNSGPSGDSLEDQIITSESQVLQELSKNEYKNTKDAMLIQTPAAEGQIPSGSLAGDAIDGPVPEENGGVGDSKKQNGVPSPEESTTKASISPVLVKQLREETGAGMMDCKKALSETEGDIIKAQEFLRKKGLASADKKASRATAEGRIGSYIHDSRIGVLVEVNCETDFVSRGDIFRELVDDLAMQVAACPQVQYLVTEDVPEEIVNKEREIEMQKEDLLSKPEQIRSKIVEGRIRKRLEELALLEQPFIKNDKVVVKDWVKQTIATIGENIKVKRFMRYNLGEGFKKKSQDFAAEVASQTAAIPVPAPAKEQPPAVEAEETVQKPPAATVSAALVKQLREETGAGMMDCKKALSETGGDLEKAQEYLRKKGLSTADKKSSRLAAEGRIGSYIHDSRIGVLIEVNCETDFAGRSEKFKELVDDLAMQVVACPQVQSVSIEDIPESIVKKEKELEMQREDLLSKPENIRERIVEGRVSKRLGELALLEQPFIKNDGILVKDLVKQTIAGLGENIRVRRFVRFTLGETVEDAGVEAEAW